MAREIINVGAAPNDGLGDPIRTAFIKTNTNFSELFARSQSTPPTTLIGAVGDIAGMTAYDQEYYYYCFQNYDGVSTIWREVPNAAIANVAVLSATGNITSDTYFIGNGSLLTGVIPAAPVALINGTTNVTTAASGNANISIAGTGNVAVFTTTGINVAGVVSASGNITAAAFSGAGTGLTGTAASLTAGSATSATSATTAGTVTTAAQANITSVGTLTSLSVVGNTITGNLISLAAISASGTVSAGGNVAGAFIIGDGGFLSNVTATGNVAVTQIQDGTTLLKIDGPGGNIIMDVDGAVNLMVFKPEGLELTGNANITGNVNSANAYLTGRFIAVGNVTGGNITTSGLIVTTSNIVGINVNASQQMSAAGNITGGNILTGGLISATGNIIGGNISTTGKVTAGNLTTGNSIINAEISTSGNVTGINLITGGLVSAVGNVIGGNIVAVGIFSGPTVSVTGNVKSSNVNAGLVTSTGNVDSDNIYLTGRLVAVGNVTGGNITSAGLIVTTGNLVGGNVVATGNIAGSYFIGNGALLSGIDGGTPTKIQNGTSEANIGVSGGNVNISIGGTSNVVVVASTGLRVTGLVSASGNVTGTSFVGIATSARYADLAENYLADANYAPGTVVEFGGAAEVTIASDETTRIAGVVSTHPAHLMNSHLVGPHVVAVALIGRVPVRVRGTINKGDMLISAGGGYARPKQDPVTGTIIGKALEASIGDNIIEVVVGRL